MKILEEFKAFAIKGNVVDMAVGIIIGGAFGKIVSSFVSDVLMPPIGIILGNIDLKGLKIPLRNGATWNYGIFLQNVVDFLIVAFSIFMMIKLMNKLNRKEDEKKEEKPTEPSNQEILLAEIRDELRKRNK